MGRSQSKGLKNGTKASSKNNDCYYYYKQLGYMKKNYFKYKDMPKKKGHPWVDGVSTSGKQSNQVGVAEKAVEEPCDALLVNPSRGKGELSDAWLLDLECIYWSSSRGGWIGDKLI